MTEIEEIVKMQQRTIDLLKQREGEPWYVAFDLWFMENNFSNELKYDPRLKQFYKYDKGVYTPTSKHQIDQLVFDWGEFVNMAINPSKLTLLIKRIKAKIEFFGVWDADPNIDNCLNGLVNKAQRTLIKHNWDYPCLEQIQRHYDPDVDPVIPPLFYELLSIIPIQQEKDCFIQFIINVVHKFFDDELFCVLYGPKSGGKSTILQIFELVFGVRNVGKTPLQKIGKRFGLKEIYNKRMNVNPDLPIIQMDDFTISLLKQLTGNDGTIEVELKGKDSFSYPVRCFLIFGINQLMQFKASSEKEIESIFRRALLINLPKTLERNVVFKRKLENPAFLDQLYSWLVNMPPRAIVEDIDTWVNIQKEKWLKNANPILTICQELFQYCEGQSMFVRKVHELVGAELESDGFTPQQKQTNITQALQTMKIYRNGKRTNNAQYINIEERLS